jgi:RNA polymerase sigma-70 factor (ECF subfamily)
MDETSFSLLDRIRRQSDRESWDRLVTIYTPLLRQWLARFRVQESDADDLVQEVFSILLRKLPAFEHNQRTGAFRNWLRTILVNCLRNSWRRSNQRPTAPDQVAKLLDELADDSSELSQVWRREHDEYIMRRLMELVQPRVAAETWKAFCRQAIDGEPAAVVAQELDISLDSAYAAKSRVLQALRQEAQGLID